MTSVKIFPLRKKDQSADTITPSEITGFSICIPAVHINPFHYFIIHPSPPPPLMISVKIYPLWKKRSKCRHSTPLRNYWIFLLYFPQFTSIHSVFHSGFKTRQDKTFIIKISPVQFLGTQLAGKR